MPTPPLPDRVAALLARPDPAVMGTLAADGRPGTAAEDWNAYPNREGPQVSVHVRVDRWHGWGAATPD